MKYFRIHCTYDEMWLLDEPLVRKPTSILAAELVNIWFGNLHNDLGFNATSGQNNTSCGANKK